MEAVRLSETSDNFNDSTGRNIPEDGHVHIRRRENLTFHKAVPTSSTRRSVPKNAKIKDRKYVAGVGIL